MAYSDFTLDRLMREFGVKVRGERSLFTDVAPIEPSPWLSESLARANNIGFGSEKSRSERLVSPVLMELSNLNQDNFAIISGANLDVDVGRGLNGECDFILSFTRLQDFVQAPVFCITEAKKQDVEMGTAQCAAQLLGAAQLNRQAQQAIPTLYGCSTTGIEWRFLRFESNTFVLDETRYLISDLPKLLGVLQQVLNWQKFAQRSEPLEGIYITDALPRPDPGNGNKFSFNVLCFYRDGTFLDTSISTPDPLLDMNKVASGFTRQQRGSSGHYSAAEGELQLHFVLEKSASNFQCPGSIAANGDLLVKRYSQAQPLLFKKWQP